jgi:predicted TIM-barrel fold metal-dependent hydrolase
VRAEAIVIVDAHAHVFRPADVSPRGVDALAPAQRDAPVEALLSDMDERRVGAAVLVPLDEHDDYVRDVLRAHSRRFVAIAVADEAVQGRGRADPVDRLKRRRDGFDFRALRTRWLGTRGRPIRESPFFPVLRFLADEGLCLWTYLAPDQRLLADELARELPGLTMVLNHLGFFPHDMRVDAYGRPAFDDPFPASTRAVLRRLGRRPNVHVLFSGQYALSRREPPYADLDEVVHEIAGAFGASRMLWGSDYPWTREVPGYPALLELPRATFPRASPGELADIQGGTALRLFPHLRPIEDH